MRDLRALLSRRGRRYVGDRTEERLFLHDVPIAAGYTRVLVAGLTEMPIRPYLNGRTFAPETIAVMNAAFEEACKALNIDTNNPTRAMVAQTIISLVVEGVTDAHLLAAATVEDMRGPKSATA